MASHDSSPAIQRVGWAKRSVPTIRRQHYTEMVGTSLALLCTIMRKGRRVSPLSAITYLQFR